MMRREQLPWELEEEILSLIPVKSLVRFRSVCKRWHKLFSDKRFVNKQSARARPQFILLAESKICLVDVNLDGSSIEVHSLPQSIPGYGNILMTLEYCDGLLIYATSNGTGVCNPTLGQIRWYKPKIHHLYNGVGYDKSRPDSHYKLFESYRCRGTNFEANITEFGSESCNLYEFAYDKGLLMSTGSVSLNGDLYWVAYNSVSHEHFIQSFDFSKERFEPYCILPNERSDLIDATATSLAVYRGDRFSFLEQNYDTGNIKIWVTKEKIRNGDGEAVEWLELMNVLVPESSSLIATWDAFPRSYFIDHKSLSLVMCFLNKEAKACIYIAKGDTFDEIEIKELVGVGDRPRHHAYCPSLVQVPGWGRSQQEVDSRFALPRGVEAINGVGGKEWDDGPGNPIFDRVKKISVGQNELGAVFIKFHYLRHNVTVAGDGHGNATTHNPEDDLLIAAGDCIEAVEGTYTESHITSIVFRCHERTLKCGLFDGTPFVLRGGRGSKIIGFYGKSSDVHLTALGVHFSASV